MSIKNYIKREAEDSLTQLSKDFPCIALLGARQVGKSTLLQKIAPDAKFFDLERRDNLERIKNDPDFFLETYKSEQIVIDEAQLCPELFPALRVAIDQDREHMGKYIISGSSSPQLLKNISESLAGRIAIYEIPPLSWNEALEKPKSKFYEFLFKPKKFTNLTNNYENDDLFKLALTGLYPEPFLKSGNLKAYDVWIESYFETYIERDIRSLFPELKLDAYRRFIKMLAFSSGELINASNFARSIDVSQPTVKRYMEIAEGTFLWRKLLCYTENSTKRLVKTPKGHLRDTIISNYLLNVNTKDDLLSHPQFGRIWESFVTEQIIKNLDIELFKHKEYFYRTHHQAEVDLILEGRFGLIPIEIKSGTYTKKDQIRSLKNFVEEQESKFGILINNGDEVIKLTENIYQIPAKYI